MSPAEASLWRIKTSPSEARVCVRADRIGSPETCVLAKDGVAELSLASDLTLQPLLIEVSAKEHFPWNERLSRLDLPGLSADREVRLKPFPSLRWRGFREQDGRTSVGEFEWLPARERPSWVPLGKIPEGATLVLPGKVRAVRFSPVPRGMSPRTFFALAPEEPFGDLGPAALAPGGEVSLCLIRRNARRPIQKASLEILRAREVVQTKVLDAAGCAAFPYLPEGLYEVRPAQPLRLPLKPVSVRVHAGRSTFLGTLEVESLGRLRIRVDDTDPERLYSANVEPLLAEPPSSGSEAPGIEIREAPLSSKSEASWDLPSGDYEVKVVSRLVPPAEWTEEVVLLEGEETTLSISPEHVRVVGTVRRGDEPTPHTALRFTSSKGEAKLSARCTSDPEGRYQVNLPSSGRWFVHADEPGVLHWRPQPLAVDIPPVPLYEWDLELPHGRVKGRVFHSRNRRGISGLPVRIRWAEASGEEHWVTARTDDEGRFQAGSLPQATVSVTTLEGAAALLGFLQPKPVVVSLEQESLAQVDIPLDPARGAVVRVVDKTGGPIAGVTVFLGGVEPLPALLGITGSDGTISLPEDTEPGRVLYAVAHGRPWTFARLGNVPNEENTIVLEEPQSLPTEIVFQKPGSPLHDVPWGLRDRSGYEVPVFFHMLRQGAYPLVRAGRVVLPQPQPGAYDVWVGLPDGARVRAGTITLPSSGPLVLPVPEK